MDASYLIGVLMALYTTSGYQTRRDGGIGGFSPHY